MRIAIVINTSWNIYNFRRGLVESLTEDGHELLLIAPYDEYSERIKSWGTYIPLIMDNTGTNPVKDGLLWLALRRIYARERPNIALHFTIKPNIYGTLAARSLGIPSINNVSGLGTIFVNENLTSRIGRVLYRFAFSKECHVLFQNVDDQNDFNEVVSYRSQNSLVPGSGIDLERFQYFEPPENDIPRFLMVARLLKDKGVTEFLEAAEQMNNDSKKAEFVLAGELDESHVRGISKDQLEKYISTRSLTYLGHVDNVQEEMKKADWVVLPSYREGTPRTLLEAAALGRPLITSDVPGCREVVTHKANGFLCPPRDVTGLVKTMEMAIEMKQAEVKQMGEKSREIAMNRFDQKIVIGHYKSLIVELTERPV